MGLAQRRKGANGEREASDALAAHGLCCPRNARAGVDDACDLIGEGISIEVKRRNRLAIDGWMAQALRSKCSRNDIHALCMRSDHGQWLLCVRVADLSDLVDIVSKHRMQLMSNDDPE